MCGIVGAINFFDTDIIADICKKMERRGRDSSGIIALEEDNMIVQRADFQLSKLLSTLPSGNYSSFFAHSRLITNSIKENQPVKTDNVYVFHNGIILNKPQIEQSIGSISSQTIDSAAINLIVEDWLLEARAAENELDIEMLKNKLALLKGTVSSIIYIPNESLCIAYSNNGSLYYIQRSNGHLICSERHPLSEFSDDVHQLKGMMTFSVVGDGWQNPKNEEIELKGTNKRLLAPLIYKESKAKLLRYSDLTNNLKRCTKCILPETMPFIEFDSAGVCNYCNSYQPREIKGSLSGLEKLVEPYRRNGSSNDVIIPFSGGRDSVVSLHIAVKELGLSPITYTYDWGMVTDLGRRNISLMCQELGVENIIVAADIHKKRNNIHKNLKAWLRNPHLGMLNILMAGDKHFFRYVEKIKQETGISLNLWGVNPLETTHFKSGFLGMSPNLGEKKVYNSTLSSQLKYHRLRLKQMFLNPLYFNSSLLDTYIGEYYRSVHKKSDYFHVFDYWKWNEAKVEKVLDTYGWERAIDTGASWRIGDGTAAFYNYVYYTVAGFSEHDTFRSNQIREGDLTRSEALELVNLENQPRYENIAWYLNSVGFKFEDVINVVHQIPKLYNE